MCTAGRHVRASPAMAPAVSWLDGGTRHGTCFAVSCLYDCDRYVKVIYSTYVSYQWLNKSTRLRSIVVDRSWTPASPRAAIWHACWNIRLLIGC